jgi:hypothetical protein
MDEKEQLAQRVREFIRENCDVNMNVNYGQDHNDQWYVIFDSWGEREKFEEMIENDFSEEEIDEINRIFEFVFSDEYDLCQNCYRVIRTSPDSYSWVQTFWIQEDGGIYCEQCVRKEYADDYLEEKINNFKSANTIFSEAELIERGYVKLENEYEVGWHEHQDDDPEKIFKKLVEKHKEILFNIDWVGQFDCHYSVYIKQEKTEE